MVLLATTLAVKKTPTALLQKKRDMSLQMRLCATRLHKHPESKSGQSTPKGLHKSIALQTLATSMLHFLAFNSLCRKRGMEKGQAKK